MLKQKTILKLIIYVCISSVTCEVSSVDLNVDGNARLDDATRELLKASSHRPYGRLKEAIANKLIQESASRELENEILKRQLDIIMTETRESVVDNLEEPSVEESELEETWEDGETEDSSHDYYLPLLALTFICFASAACLTSLRLLNAAKPVATIIADATSSSSPLKSQSPIRVSSMSPERASSLRRSDDADAAGGDSAIALLRAAEHLEQERAIRMELEAKLAADASFAAAQASARAAVAAAEARRLRGLEEMVEKLKFENDNAALMLETQREDMEDLRRSITDLSSQMVDVRRSASSFNVLVRIIT